MLMRFDPFRELDRMTQAPWGNTRPVMPMDAYRRNGDFVVHFDVPGVDPASIDLTVEKNVLTVTAERHFPRQEGDEITVSERPPRVGSTASCSSARASTPTRSPPATTTAC